jgi:NAD(P)-dependent dehydrogenase (short-subunit alcohol dehydrogenase family)
VEDSPFSFDGKHAIVVGGASGIGAATADVFGRLGADVVVLDIQPAPGDTPSISVDLTDKASIERAVDECAGPIDVLASCAGVADGTPGLATINFIGQRHLVERIVGRGLMPRGSAIAMVSSAAGRGWEAALPALGEYLDTPTFEAGEAWIAAHPEMGDYLHSKQVVCAYVARQAYRFGKLGIRINALMPGPTDTPLARANADIWLKYASDYRTELGLAPSTPEEQAWILAFLCSGAAARVIGESIGADAGAGMSRLTGTFTPSFD